MSGNAIATTEDREHRELERPDERDGDRHGNPEGSRTELLVSGMTCNNCARHVAEALRAVPGVESAAVHLEAGEASVHWSNPAAARTEPLLAALHEAGYGGKLKKSELRA